MNPTRWRIAALLVFAIVAQLLLGCGATSSPAEPETPPSPSFAVFATPVPNLVVADNPDFDNSQATLTDKQVRQTVVAEAHVIVAGELTQTAQAVEATNAYPLAVTSSAATQTALLVQQYGHEQDNFVNRVVTPLIPVMAGVLLVMLVVLVIALLKRQFIPRQWFNSTRNPRQANNYPGNMITIDGEVSPYYNHPSRPATPPDLSPENTPALPCEKQVYVEVVNANEAPAVHWVDDMEHQLAGERGAGI